MYGNEYEISKLHMYVHILIMLAFIWGYGTKVLHGRPIVYISLHTWFPYFIIYIYVIFSPHSVNI